MPVLVCVAKPVNVNTFGLITNFFLGGRELRKHVPKLTHVLSVFFFLQKLQ